MKVTLNNFITEEIKKDLENKRYTYVQTRQPPEPSGYLHIAHCRGILLNYGLAEQFNGVCNLRFDDTNPDKEDEEFVNAIKKDVHWLGFKYANVLYATDYFQQNYDICVKLIKEGKAYVCDLTKEQIAETKGDLTKPGQLSPFRNRTVEENLKLFAEMKEGKFEQGSRSVRAKIDMAHPNMLMRDPVLYRIQYGNHHRIGRSWNVYPSYDFSHPLDDSLEGVTHSICGSEFIEHRPLYDWVVNNCGLKHKSRQIEYGNVYLEGVVLGKRHIKKLVAAGDVEGFDDPRLYTLAGLRRRGVLPQSILKFMQGIGLTNTVSNIDINFFNSFIRDDLNQKAKRVMAVLKPLKLIITNYDKKECEEVVIKDFPQKKTSNKTHTHYFGRELYIERDDFMASPIPKFTRMYVGNEVRLNGAYIIKCTGFDVDENGEVICVYAEYDKDTKSGGTSTKKVKSTIHYVCKKNAKEIIVNQYENLFSRPDETTKEEDVISGYRVNHNTKRTFKAYIENLNFKASERYQFMRNGYYCLDNKAKKGELIFNETIGLKDSFHK